MIRKSLFLADRRMAPALPHSVWVGVYTLLQESEGKRLELKRTMIPHDLLAPGERVVQPH